MEFVIDVTKFSYDAERATQFDACSSLSRQSYLRRCLPPKVRQNQKRDGEIAMQVRTSIRCCVYAGKPECRYKNWGGLALNELNSASNMAFARAREHRHELWRPSSDLFRWRALLSNPSPRSAGSMLRGSAALRQELEAFEAFIEQTTPVLARQY